jgi:DNA-binding response OmpR family regulator
MSSKNIKVLLIEDDHVLAGIYATKLEQLGYEYKIAEDGEAGIKAVYDFMPDIILLDIILPKQDGFTVLEILKSNEQTKDIPVILLTNLGQDDDIERGLALGANSYLVKTQCTPSQAVDEIKKVLG